MIGKQEIMDKLKEVIDPDIGLNIVDLGLVYDIEINDNNNVSVRMTLTSPGCPIGPVLMSQVEEAVKNIPDASQVSVHLVWEPAWNPETMASDAAKDALGIW